MKVQIFTSENYLYELLKKKYHTSEVVRAKIADIKEKTKEAVTREPLKSFNIKFRGQVIDSSFEKTLKIISKRLFNKGKVDSFHTFKEYGLVEANITATLIEVEALVQYLMKPHIVLHCKKGIAKGASNLLIIDETEQDQLNNFTPDYTHRNYVTHAESYEKYTGRLGDYLVFNGLPLTTEKIGRELRFNKIETKNRVFTTTGLKEINLNLHLISLILKLDLEQHYLKLRVFNSQEEDLKMVEEKIDDLGFFADIFNQIATTDNPLLFNEYLFLDLIRLEPIVENNNWKAIPAYAGYIYSAANKLNGQFKLLEEYNLFLTYANCIEKFIVKLSKKLIKHKLDFHSEQHNLLANYNELKKLNMVMNHPLLQSDYQELLNSFSKLLAYLDFLTIRGTSGEGTDSARDVVNIPVESSNRFVTIIKKCIESVFSVTIGISAKPVFRKDPILKTEQEEDVQKLITKFNENLEKLSKLKTIKNEDAFLEARRHVPQLTNLSDTLDQLKELIKAIEIKREIIDPFKIIFAKSNKFEILCRELNNLGILKTTQDQELIRVILADLQKYLFNRPLKENTYKEILDRIKSLEDFITSRSKPNFERDKTTHTVMLKLYQNPVFKTIIDIRMGIENIVEKEAQNQKINTFKNETEFSSYSAKELDEFLAYIIKFHEKLKDVCYYKNISEFETVEKEFDRLIDEVKAIDSNISFYTRNKDKRVSKEPDVHINYLKSSQLTRKNLEKAILLLQNQITQMDGFVHDIESNLQRHSFIHSGVATSVLFDQITYLLSNIDVRLLDMTKLTENMFNESVNTIFHYQAGESFTEPKNENIDDLMKEIEKRTIVRKYQSHENNLPSVHLS
ncbi:MAG: hypothetical protein A2099_07825 [Planctomycetes bacterium GWF2_39_10]|nr:MAG: hypothetical protein A2099_07825 [Planctomycetes bacterium GWF2_39_10]